MQTLTSDEQRAQIVRNISECLMTTPFTFEFKVKKKPSGIHIVYEITQEEMDRMCNEKQ